MSDPACPFDRLSDDQLLHLLTIAAAAATTQQQQQQRYLYGIFPLVCKRLLEVTTSSTCNHPIFITDAADPATLSSWVSKHGACVQQLTLPTKQELLEHPGILPALQNLRSLHISCPDSAAPEAIPYDDSYDCSRCLSAVTQLTSLTFSNDSGVADAQRLLTSLQPLSRLVNLQLQSTAYSSGQWTRKLLQQLASSLPHLTSIAFNSGAQLRELGALTTLQQLQRVDLKGINSQDPLDLCSFPADLPLTSVTLVIVDEESAACFVAWCSKGCSKHLQALDLDVREGPFLKVVLEQLPKQPQLRSLSIVNSFNDKRSIAASWYSALVHCTQLTGLALCDYSGGPRGEAATLKVGCIPPRLCSLCLVGFSLMDWLEQQQKQQLGSCLKQLTSLKLSHAAAGTIPCIASLTRLKELSICFRAQIAATSLLPLSSLSSLTSFGLTSHQLHTEEILGVVSVLSGLQRLDLRKASNNAKLVVDAPTAAGFVLTLPQLSKLSVYCLEYNIPLSDARAVSSVCKGTEGASNAPVVRPIDAC